MMGLIDRVNSFLTSYQKITLAGLLTLCSCFSTTGQSLGYNEFFQIIKLYQDGRYDIVASKFKNQGYLLDKHTPDYELNGVKYVGDFSFTLKREVFYKNNRSYGSSIELINNWTFKTIDYPSYIEYEIEFGFEDSMAPTLFNSLRETWIEEIGEPVSTDCANNLKDDCALFIDKKEVSGKNIEKPNSLITLTPRKRFRVTWSEFFSATRIIEGRLEYRLVKFPIEQSQDDYFRNQIQGANSQSIPLKKKGNLYTIELRIGGRNFEYIVDSGASDINISKSTEDYLVDMGIIRSTDYLRPQIYTLADGSQKEYRRVMIPKILLAGIIVENVSASISDDDNHPLLLGKSFLDKFSFWKINNEKVTVEFRVK